MSPVPSCHDDGTPAAAAGAPLVVLAGSPNVGKSTLFNGLTGARRSVGNWPGTTVEVGRAAWRLTDGREIDLLELPGAYSLDAMSPDEQLTRDVVLAHLPAGAALPAPATVPAGPPSPADRPDDVQDGAQRAPDVVVVVVSAADLARSLYLVEQLLEHPLRIVVALTMLDVARRRGTLVDPGALAAGLGVPVVALDPRRRTGGDELSATIAEALDGGPVCDCPGCAGGPCRCTCAPGPDAAAGRGLREPADPDEDPLALADHRFARIAEVVATAVTHSGADRTRWTGRIDRVVTAPVLGPLLFLGVMWLVFRSTTTLAAPLQNGLDALFSGPVTAGAERALAALGLAGTWVRGLIVDGIIGGIGMLLTFVPLMAIMFVLLALLEDSGYLARAAVVTDRLMRAIGLPGKAFLPLIVGFGCNVPAISATRVLGDARQRLLTAMLVPFTSCSARLPVYVLVASTVFGARSGDVVFMMYVVSVLMVILGGLLLRGTLLRGVGAEPLVLDLPPYQVPALHVLGRVTWSRLAAFLRGAAGIIMITVIGVWLLSAIPVRGGGEFGKVPVGDSAFGSVAHATAPVFGPAGFGDWRASGALLVGFVAKEAVISSWAQTYAAQTPADLRRPGELGDQVRGAFTESSDGHPRAAVLAFMIFLLAYTPCVATISAQVREIGRRWTLVGVGLQLGVAWSAAVAVFQVGRLFG